jgi:hypothetical protein
MLSLPVSEMAVCAFVSILQASRYGVTSAGSEREMINTFPYNLFACRKKVNKKIVSARTRETSAQICKIV